MYLDEVEVVHEGCRSNILAFLNSLQSFGTAPALLGDGIETVAVTTPLAQNLTEAKLYCFH